MPTVVIHLSEKEGPVHHCSWAPTAKEFLVIYGCIQKKWLIFDYNRRYAC